MLTSFGNSLLNSNIDHGIYDVWPYNQFGNAKNDPTNEDQWTNRGLKYLPAAGRDIKNTAGNITDRISNGINNLLKNN